MHSARLRRSHLVSHYSLRGDDYHRHARRDVRLAHRTQRDHGREHRHGKIRRAAGRTRTMPRRSSSRLVLPWNSVRTSLATSRSRQVLAVWIERAWLSQKWAVRYVPMPSLRDTTCASRLGLQRHHTDEDRRRRRSLVGEIAIVSSVLLSHVLLLGYHRCIARTDLSSDSSKLLRCVLESSHSFSSNCLFQVRRRCCCWPTTMSTNCRTRPLVVWCPTVVPVETMRVSVRQR